MSIGYRIAAVGTFLALAGCGSNPHYYPPPTQTTTTYAPPPPGSPPPPSTAYPQPYGQPDFLVVGDQPPPSPVVNNVRVGNFCTQVTETWVPTVDPSSGTRVWLKQVSRVLAACQ